MNLKKSPSREALPFSLGGCGENESVKRWIVAEARLESRSLTANPLLASFPTVAGVSSEG